MKARTLAVLALVAGCGSPRHLPDAAPTSPFVRALSTCKKMVPSIAEVATARPRRDADVGTFPVGADVTIRVLSTHPFLFQNAEPGTRKESPWFWRGVQIAEVDPELTKLPFGAVVKVHYTPPPIMNSTPPPHLDAPIAGPVPTAEPALLAVWRPEGFDTEVQVYADGHAFVRAPPGHFIDLPLTQAELDDFLDSFARAGLDTLPDHPMDEVFDRPGVVILACQRYREVDIRDSAQALAPVVSAFEHIRDEALARARPRLEVFATGWRPHIYEWPTDAPQPESGDWYNLKDAAAAGDSASPMFRKLPDDIAAALPGADRQRPLVVRAHDDLLALVEDHCKTCRPGTYSSVLVLEKMTLPEAPDWAPDFAHVGKDGVWLEGRDPRWKTLDGQYRQRGEVFAIRQAETLVDPKR